MNLNTLPVIDWELAIQVAGQQKDLATQLLTHLTKHLPNDVTAIQSAYQAQNYPEMLRLVHKLHGALCYCGTPRLKTVVACLETNLKNNIMESLPLLIDTLMTEVNLLLEHSPLPHMQRLQEP